MLGIVACRISCLAGYLILLVFPVRRYKESAAAEIERDRRVVGHAAALGDAYATLTRGESGLPQLCSLTHHPCHDVAIALACSLTSSAVAFWFPCR